MSGLATLKAAFSWSGEPLSFWEWFELVGQFGKDLVG
jgi:hypothetical protein